MEIKKLDALIETLNKYLSENGSDLVVTGEAITSDKSLLDKVTDEVIALICKIGIDENFSPNLHGVILDGCLETLNNIREEFTKMNKYIDHTNLKPSATEADIEKLCHEAAEYHFATVCINPYNIPQAKKLLENTDVKVCSVVGFPSGANSTSIKVAETEDAYAMGCDEFDMVINVGALKDGKLDYVRDDVAAVVAAAKGRCVKVIIETGLLTDEEKVTAVRLCCEAGAHFVKTSTGITSTGATVADVILMKQNVSNGTKVKAAGGIRTAEFAKELIEAGAERIGTSAGMTIVS